MEILVFILWPPLPPFEKVVSFIYDQWIGLTKKFELGVQGVLCYHHPILLAFFLFYDGSGWQNLTFADKGCWGVSRILTFSDRGGEGLPPPCFGWRHMWTAPQVRTRQGNYWRMHWLDLMINGDFSLKSGLFWLMDQFGSLPSWVWVSWLRFTTSIVR